MVKTGLKSAGASDMGRVRKNNEDAWHIDTERGIFLVVDGIGGHAAGEKAAEIAVERVRARLERQTGAVEQRIREAIALANNEILRSAADKPEWEGMACVLTLAVLENGSAVVGHVGDSRLYRIRAGEIRKITHDHSPVGEREDVGELSEADAMRHPRRNEVFRDVGTEEHAPDDPDFIEVQRIAFEPDAALLLCSDGLSDQVSSDQIRETVERHAGNPDAAARELIDAANRAGGKDNVTIVIVEGDQFTAPPVESSPPRRSWFVPFVVAVALLLLAVAGAIWWKGRRPEPVAVRTPQAFTVGANGLASISAALAQARDRDTIYVGAGEYREQLTLKSGVAIIARPPREAVLRAPAVGPGPAIVADRVEFARLSGLNIQANAEMPLSAGIVLTDSSVEIDDMEIAGPEVGIVIRGGGRSTLRGNAIHDCTAVGVLIAGPAQPYLSHNSFVRNKKAGVAGSEGARPALTGNVFDRSKVELPPEIDMKVVREHNFFVGGPAPAPAGAGRGRPAGERP
jgi:serine/threonine protein phosphatase PrpC